MTPAITRSTIEIIDAGDLTIHQREALDDLLDHRHGTMPDLVGVELPRRIDDAAVPADAFVVLAWADEATLSAAVIGVSNENTDPAMAAFEGCHPLSSQLVIFRSTYHIDDIPRPFAHLRQKYPATDRITLHVPLGDSATATALGRLGFTLDSYLAIRPAAPPQAIAPPANIAVRVAAPADATGIAALSAQHIADQRDTTAFLTDHEQAVAETAAGVASRMPGESTFHVAEHHGEIVGAIETSTFGFDTPLRRIPIGQAGAVQWLCVAPDHRRQGIGAALITAAVRSLADAGADYTYVFHGANNPLSTSRFWRRFGFRPTWGTWEAHVAVE